MNRATLAAWSACLAGALLVAQMALLRWAPSEAWVRVGLPVTVALVPAALWMHRRHLGVWIMFVGFAANLSAIAANGGLMPIERATVISAIGEERAAEYEAGRWLPGSKDVLVDGEGRLSALGDAIIIRLGGRGVAASAGDIVVWCGLLVLAAEASVAWQRRARGARDGPAPVEARGGAITRT
jgi:hypothetical protein